jgi:hypothetical protein
MTPCRDCNNPEPEYYMVRNTLWQRACAATPIVQENCQLCLTCLSRRLGRPLVRRDFPANILCNWGLMGFNRSKVRR